MLSLLQAMSASRKGKYIANQSAMDSLTINAGDRVYLQAGGTYKTSKIIPSGVIIDRYGVGDAPILVGSNVLSGFTDEGGGIYSIATSEPKWVYIESVDAAMAKTIDYTVTSILDEYRIQVAAGSLSGVDVIGAKLVAKSVPFAYSLEYTIVGFSNDIITVNNSMSDDFFPPSAGDKFNLYNRHSYISNDYDFAYESGVLRIKLPSLASNYTISAVDVDYSLKINGGNCVIKNIEFKNYYQSAIHVDDSINNTIQNCKIHNVREHGVRITGNGGQNTVTQSEVYDIGNIGLFNEKSDYFTATDNIIHDIGVGSTIGWLSSNSGKTIAGNGSGINAGTYNIALNKPCDGVIINGNTIYNTAYNGTTSGGCQNMEISYNIVSNPCVVLLDGGGIYTFFYRSAYPEIGTGISIHHNFIYDCANNTEACIYLDNRTSGAHVHNNAIYNSPTRGIMANADTDSHYIHDNLIFRCNSGIWYRDWAAPSKQLLNDKNINEDNIIACGTTSQYCIETDDSVTPYVNGGSADRNYYINPYGVNVASINNIAATLSTLKSTYSQDVNSVGLTNYIPAPGDPDNEMLLITNPSDSQLTGNAPSGTWKDVDGNVVTNYTVNAWSSLLLLKNLP